MDRLRAVQNNLVEAQVARERAKGNSCRGSLAIVALALPRATWASTSLFRIAWNLSTSVQGATKSTSHIEVDLFGFRFAALIFMIECCSNLLSLRGLSAGPEHQPSELSSRYPGHFTPS